MLPKAFLMELKLFGWCGKSADGHNHVMGLWTTSASQDSHPRIKQEGHEFSRPLGIADAVMVSILFLG